jgi:hypothetical protein
MMRRREVRRLSIPAAFACLAYAIVMVEVCGVWANSQGGPETAEGITLKPGIVVGLTNRTVYLMDPGGGIDAVAITNGIPRWLAKAASVPLLLYDRYLIASAETTHPHSLTVTTLDSAIGAFVNSGSLALPEEIRASIDDEPGSSFTVSAEPSPKGVLVSWKYVHRVLSGRLAPEGSSTPSIREGTALFDPSSGEIRPFVAAESPPAVEDLQRTGDYLVRLQPSNTSSATSTIVKRWRGLDHVALPAVEIPGALDAVAVSADGRFARVIVGRVPTEQGLIDYQWRIYSLAEGRPLGDLQLPVRTSAFLVCDRTLLYVAPPLAKRVSNEWFSQPLRIVAVDLGSHTEQWSHPLRDTTFRALLPPSSR